MRKEGKIRNTIRERIRKRQKRRIIMKMKKRVQTREEIVPHWILRGEED